jgi:hypothetical protein
MIVTVEYGLRFRGDLINGDAATRAAAGPAGRVLIERQLVASEAPKLTNLRALSGQVTSGREDTDPRLRLRPG